ncbi:MAG TPA: hypothetical protein VN371_00005 [Chlorobaculum sp.]|nr:hypothetical protein [Chlorobaculum sp.]
MRGLKKSTSGYSSEINQEGKGDAERVTEKKGIKKIELKATFHAPSGGIKQKNLQA